MIAIDNAPFHASHHSIFGQIRDLILHVQRCRCTSNFVRIFFSQTKRSAIRNQRKPWIFDAHCRVNRKQNVVCAMNRFIGGSGDGGSAWPSSCCSESDRNELTSDQCRNKEAKRKIRLRSCYAIDITVAILLTKFNSIIFLCSAQRQCTHRTRG